MLPYICLMTHYYSVLSVLPKSEHGILVKSHKILDEQKCPSAKLISSSKSDLPA